MKFSDQCWLEATAQEAMGIPVSNRETPLTTFGQAIQIFLDELCGIMETAVYGFNDRVHDLRPDLLFQIFKMGHGKQGIILLRNKDKLVISGDGGKIHVKVVRVHAYNEKSLEAIEFRAEPFDERGNMSWKDAQNNQYVTPELVMKHYLTPFFILGSDAYITDDSNAEAQPKRAGAHAGQQTSLANQMPAVKRESSQEA